MEDCCDSSGTKRENSSAYLSAAKEAFEAQIKVPIKPPTTAHSPQRSTQPAPQQIAQSISSAKLTTVLIVAPRVWLYCIRYHLIDSGTMASLFCMTVNYLCL